MEGSSGSTTVVNPSYGESLREALEAQTALLTGSRVGESDFSKFSEIGGLQGLLERYERPLRMSQAQTGTDVLRQTLLGNRTPIYESDNTVAQEAQTTTPTSTTPAPTETAGSATTETPATTGVTKNPYPAGSIMPSIGAPPGSSYGTPYGMVTVTPSGEARLVSAYTDEQYSALMGGRDPNGGTTERRAGNTLVDYGGTLDPTTGKIITGYSDVYKNPEIDNLITILESNASETEKLRAVAELGPILEAEKPGQGIDLAGEIILTGDVSKNSIRNLINTYPDSFSKVPVYKKDADGNDVVVPMDEKGNPISEAGDDTTVNIPGAGEVEKPPLPPGVETEATPVVSPDGKIIGYKRSGDGLVDLLGDNRMAIDPTTGLPSTRQSGFNEDGEFLGLAALAEDISRGNLSRQREADISDVERLSGRYQAIMDEYKPGTKQALSDASAVLESQKDSLTGAGAITVPSASTYGGDVTAGTMQAAQVADPLKLSANTQFGGELGLGKTSTGDDSLRSVLLGDARTALGEGLTEREQANIANTARARSTLMGRTFDQSGAIAEAEARVAEDNNRRMQNRSFAQSVLGQEAGYQQGDITRGMAQESEQAGLQQRADLAQAQMDQQANAFDADAALRASMVNQGQKQQANQFGVGATMDAERLNEQLKQQGTLGYIDAATRLAALEDQYTLDPFAAILGRGGGGSLQGGQGVLNSAGYGLNSSSQFLNPESGLGFISNQAANAASLYAADAAANASRSAGMMGGLGSLFGGVAGGLIGLAG